MSLIVVKTNSFFESLLYSFPKTGKLKKNAASFNNRKSHLNKKKADYIKWKRSYEADDDNKPENLHREKEKQ